MESQEKHRISKRKPDGLLKHCRSTALSGFRKVKVSEVTSDEPDFVEHFLCLPVIKRTVDDRND
jgi:hypothetical protein